MGCSTVFILSKSQLDNPQFLTLLHLPRQPLLEPGDPPPVVLQHVLHLGLHQDQPHPQISLRPDQLGELVAVLPPEQSGPLDVEIISQELIVMLRQLSYAIKNQLKAPKESIMGGFMHRKNL